jgi:hypothetical protein
MSTVHNAEGLGEKRGGFLSISRLLQGILASVRKHFFLVLCAHFLLINNRRCLQQERERPCLVPIDKSGGKKDPRSTFLGKRINQGGFHIHKRMRSSLS